MELTAKLERDRRHILGALVERDKRAPRVDFTKPDVWINAEVLGSTTFVGLLARRRHEELASRGCGCKPEVFLGGETVQRSGLPLADVAAKQGVRDRRVLDAMREVDRVRFVPADHAELARYDEPVAIGHRQVTTQPSLVAAMLEALALQGDEKVLEIGTGYGYQTALLAHLARDVWSVEWWSDLADAARANLAAAGISNAEVVTGDGSEGLLEHAPYDAIVVSAAFPSVPPPLVDQLVSGGRLVQPVGPGGNEEVTVFVKEVGGLGPGCLVTYARFVPLVGAHGFRTSDPL